MEKNMKSFIKITCILWITFLMLGLFPLPLVSKITTATANVVDGKDPGSPKAFGMPNLNLSSKDLAPSKTEENRNVSAKPLGLPDLDFSSVIMKTCEESSQCDSGEECINGVCELTNPSTPPTPVDCSGHFTECSAVCGPGMVTFVIDVQANNGGVECAYAAGVQLPCNNGHCKVDCVGDWGICTGSCDTGGTQTFSITKPAANGGAECDFEDAETRDCELPGCLLDCVGEWGECEGDCGVEGVQTFNVLQAADSGGAACEFADGTTQACQNAPCQGDCIWTEWSECSAKCGGGVQTRSIAVSPKNGGAECDGPTFQACNTQSCRSNQADDGKSVEISGKIPITGDTGDSTAPLIIPVTGLDFGLNLAGLQKAFIFFGLMLFGITMVLAGIDRKRTK